MKFRPKRRRLLFLLSGVVALSAAAILTLLALDDYVDLFLMPSDVTKKIIDTNKRYRLGGLVEENSILKQSDGLTTVFKITDRNNSIEVEYKGILPNLFREGQGVVVEGRIDSKGKFFASNVLAKHDESYMPPEVAKALKESGKWKGE